MSDPRRCSCGLEDALALVGRTTWDHTPGSSPTGGLFQRPMPATSINDLLDHAVPAGTHPEDSVLVAKFLLQETPR